MENEAFMYAGQVGDTTLERRLYRTLLPWVRVMSHDKVAILTDTLEVEPDLEEWLAAAGFSQVSHEGFVDF